MPVKWVLHWIPNSGSTVNTKILSEISQCVETLNGAKGGRRKAVLTFYKPIVREESYPVEFPRDFMGLSFSDQPDKYYFVIRGHRLVIEADMTIQTIMEKLQSYRQRVSLNFEPDKYYFIVSGHRLVNEADMTIQTIMEKLQSYRQRVSLNFEGTQYLLGDFQVRVEKVTPTQSESMRGIVMEVEYLPISSIENSRQIMEEFVELLQEALSKKTLAGHFMHCEPTFSDYGLLDEYGMQHTAVQYATVMGQLIASVQSAQAMRN